MSEDEKKWLDLVIPKIAKSMGSSEKGTGYVLAKTKRCLLSVIYFVHIWYMNKINQLRELRSLVIKKPNHILETVNCQFHNEILFYQTFAQAGENFPKCFYHYEPSLNSSDCGIIALEDVSKIGFDVCPFSFDPPYSYVLAVIRELGRFHAKGYILKARDEAKFNRIVDDIVEIRYNETLKQCFGPLIDTTSTRAVDYLREHGYDTELCDKMQALFSNAYEKVMMRIVTTPTELSTICHGDVTLSNVLFQAQTNGHFNAMLIDFGMLRYSTPAIDLSTFLCLTCTNYTIRDKLYDILTVYHMALTKYLSLEGITNDQKYSYNAILKNYKEGCLFGFIIASFYLTTMRGYFDLGGETMSENVEEKCKQSGGENISAELADMLLQMVELGCLKDFL